MKKLAIVVMIIVALFALTSCDEMTQRKVGNRITDGADVQYFDYAYVMLDGKLLAEGVVKQWRDYDNSDVVQIMIGDKYYLTHYSNVVLCASGYNHVQFTSIKE